MKIFAATMVFTLFIASGVSAETQTDRRKAQEIASCTKLKFQPEITPFAERRLKIRIIAAQNRAAKADERKIVMLAKINAGEAVKSSWPDDAVGQEPGLDD